MASENPSCMPGSPALPRNSAYADHRKATPVPSEISVSMVAAPCRRLVQAALWNGQPPHTTTGAVSTRHSHCQYRNWAGGTIDSTTTGTASTSDTSSRCRRDAVGSASAAGSDAAAGGAGTSAV
jgi:hypothetical protein